MYRVVLTIVETNEKEFRECLGRLRHKDITGDMIEFIALLDVRPEVRRIYRTAKNFESYNDALRCYDASLREFDFNKESYQYFKILRIEEYFFDSFENDWSCSGFHKQIDEVSGKGEEG